MHIFKKCLGILIITSYFLFPLSTVNAQPAIQEVGVEATVTQLLENSQIIESSGNKHPYQKIEALGTSGKYKGKMFVVENGKYDETGVTEYKRGDKVMLQVSENKGQIQSVVIIDYQRSGPLFLLIAIFIILTIILGGKRGVGSLVGMLITFLVIFLFILPQISTGANPIFISIFASLFLIPATFLLAHGINMKTICAICGTFLALLIAAFLAWIFIDLTHLSGFVSEEAAFLDTLKKGSVDIKGLLYAGIFIALLGVVEDITVAQSAIVFQLRKVNKNLKFSELFFRAMDVGRDHIASMANTLIIVYAGASLPLLLLFIDSTLPASQILNQEIIAEEIVRTLVASICLIISVPITTFIAASYSVKFKDNSG